MRNDGDSGSCLLGSGARNQVVRLAIQQRHELFRAGLPRLLSADSSVGVIGSVTTPDQLLALCARALPQPDVVLVDSDARVGRVSVASLVRRAHPSTRVIGLHPGSTPARSMRESDFDEFVSRTAGVRGILAAVFAPPRSPGRPERPPAGAVAPVLTEREIEVLMLVRQGSTARLIAERLAISPHTVEHHKRHIFEKLGVQSQAHAVSVALRAGLISM